MDVQIALGADMAMVFDECVEHPASYERTRAVDGADACVGGGGRRSILRRTSTRFRGLRELGGKTQSLFGIVQGGMYADLRQESAERLVEMEFPGYAIGGLAVGEPREVTREMIARTLEWLPKDQAAVCDGRGVSG